MGFSAEQKNIYNLFSRNTYGIPRNQRRYVWQERNWEELYEDITYSVTSDTQHFLGSFVLKNEGRKNGIPNYTIIDGQQRIITLTILLGSILYKLRKEKLIDDFEGTKLYLFTKDDKAKETSMVKSDYHLSLDNIIRLIVDMDDKEFEKVSLNKLLEQGAINKRKDKNIIDAFKYFVAKLNESVNLHDLNFIIKLREATVNISYISIISSSEEDSYTIFEILNARGTELEDFELLKNYIMRYIQPEINRDRAKTIWLDIENLIGNDFKKFIKHYATHKCKYKTNSIPVYKAIQREYKARNTEELLKDLQKKSIYYSKMIDPQHNCNSESVEFRVLSFFRRKRQEQLRPVLLSIMHHHDIGEITDSAYDSMLDFLYNFYVCYNIIGEENSNKLTNVVYKYASLIENEYKEGVLEQFASELKSKLPNQEIFENSFMNIGYSKYSSFYEGEKNKSRVQTVLEVLERYMNGGFCMPDFTIEHILDDKECMENGQIGNLIPLESSTNNNLKNADYDKKIKKYSESNYKTTRSFSNRFATKESFDPNKRTKYLAKIFYENILVLKNS